MFIFSSSSFQQAYKRIQYFKQYVNFQNKNDSFKTAFKPNNQDKFDLKTYKKFLLFLKFQEMINEFNA